MHALSTSKIYIYIPTTDQIDIVPLNHTLLVKSLPNRTLPDLCKHTCKKKSVGHFIYLFINHSVYYTEDENSHWLKHTLRGYQNKIEERNVSFNDALNTFYLRLYRV